LETTGPPPPENYIQFLGTAGARFAMAKQLRSSAGTFLRLNGKNVLLDCGPGTLVKCAHAQPPIDVFALDAIILTHSHLDHSSDVNCLIDAMTAGGIWHRGWLFTPKECLEGENRVVVRYSRPFLEGIEPLEPSRRYVIDDLVFETSIAHEHGVETYGIRFVAGEEKLSFLIDTRFFPELIEDYAGSDWLIVNVVRRDEQDSPRAKHLCMDEVRDIVAALRPKKTILTHFGMRLLESGPDRLAAEMSDSLGQHIIAAHDGLVVPLPSAAALEQQRQLAG